MSKILEVEGTWVYKSKEYPGKLYYDSDYPIRLVININENKIPKENSSDSWVSEKNGLSKTILISKWNRSKSFERDLTTIICDSVVVGENLSGTFFKDNKFSKLEISFDCVSDWIEAERHIITRYSDLVSFDFIFKQNNESEKYHIKIPSDIKNKIKNIGLRNFMVNSIAKSHPKKSQTIKGLKNFVSARFFGIDCEIGIQNNSSKYPFSNFFYDNRYIISICPSTKQNYFWFEEVANSLKDMLILMSGRQISITYFKLNDLQKEATIDSVFYVLLSPEEPIINNARKGVICPFLQIESLDTFLNCWSSVYNTKLIVPIKTFTSLEFNNNIHEEIKFLSYMQALESYLNYKFNDKIISDSNFNKFCHSFEDKFKKFYYTNTDEKTKLFLEKLNDQRPQINKYNLNDKIHKFIDIYNLNDNFEYDLYLFHYIVEHFGITKDSFIQKIVNLRNKLTHHYPVKKPSEYLNKEDILLINVFLARIIIMFLFLELGFDSDTASRLMEEYESNSSLPGITNYLKSKESFNNNFLYL